MKVDDEKDRKIDSIEDANFAQYVEEHHPRWYKLAVKTEFIISDINLKDDTNKMSDHTHKIEMSFINATNEATKTIGRKLLDTMTVSALKAMLSKFFKIDVLN